MNLQRKSLRDNQKDGVVSMLNLNVQQTPTTDLVWKVLVYDKLGQQVISPILKVNDLRANGITVHMNLNVDRQPIPDVPAIYFIQPTLENIRKLGKDFSKQLYDSYYINFSHTLPRALLEELASVVLACDPAPNISQVYDQYLNYTCLESNLFSLNFSNSYQVLNDPKTSDTLIEGTVNQIVDSLFSVLVTMGSVPIIRCPKGNAAEMVATKLEGRLRDHLMNSRNDNLFSESSSLMSLSRPVLIILDRNVDLCTMMYHAWTYSTMVHDLLDMKINLVQVMSDEKKRMNYDIDTSTDFFWQKNCGLPFPQVAEDVNIELTKYKKEVEEITRSCGVASLEEVNDNTKNLSVAINQLPKLTERKRVIDMHMNIAYSLMKIVESRQLDSFFSMEETIMKQTKSTLLEVIKDPKKSSEDKLRLFIIYYLSVGDNVVNKQDMNEYEKALEDAGCSNLSSLNYIKSVKTFSKMASQQTQQTANSSGASDFIGRFTPSVVGGSLGDFITSVKNLLPTTKDLPVTRTVDMIMEGGGEDGGIDEFLYLDPKVSRGAKGKKGKGEGFAEATIFVIGGGNYLEYHNLMDYAKRSTHGKKKITYGSTEMLTSQDFLNQLEKL